MSRVKTNHPDFDKDTDTGVVLNNNVGSFVEYKAKRERSKEFSQLKADVEMLKRQMSVLLEKGGA